MSHCNICIIPSRQGGAPMQGQTSLAYTSDCQEDRGAVPTIYSPKDHRRVVSVKAKLAPKINSERVIKTTMTEFTEEVIGHTANFLPLLDRFIKLPCTNLL